MNENEENVDLQCISLLIAASWPTTCSISINVN